MKTPQPKYLRQEITASQMAFEEYAKRRRMDLYQPYGHYQCRLTDEAWAAWQAARALDSCIDVAALIEHNNAAIELAHARLIRINELEDQLASKSSQPDFDLDTSG